MVVWLKKNGELTPRRRWIEKYDAADWKLATDQRPGRIEKGHAKGKMAKRKRDRSAFGYEIWWSVGHLLRRKRRIGQDEEKKELNATRQVLADNNFQSLISTSFFFNLCWNIHLIFSRLYFPQTYREKSDDFLFGLSRIEGATVGRKSGPGWIIRYFIRPSAGAVSLRLDDDFSSNRQDVAVVTVG